MINCFDEFWPINKVHNILNEGDLYLIFEKLHNDTNFKKSEKEIEPFESIENLKYSQDSNSDSPIVNILDNLNEKEMNDPWVQASCKRSKHSSISILQSIRKITIYHEINQG